MAKTTSPPTSSSTDTAPANSQFMVCWTWSMMICVIIVSLRPPSSAGVMKQPMAVTPTMMAAAAPPGLARGK
ncbi:hypothetical protein G6F24_018756 [Rhizopus arrhizus]|nr:hypothetical protein G6F24_018756 [Rhizopus arrhizus]